MEYELEVKYQSEVVKGILINEERDVFVVKLSSGYNANLLKKDCEVISKKKIEVKTKVVSDVVNSSENLPKLVILHTGGTIASKVDYATGAVSSKFKPNELLNLYPELQDKVQIEAKMIGNLFSEDLRFAHYNLMLKQIDWALSQNPIGIIISHGTDTMSYTASALEYSCENLPVPVLLVGAQRSSDRPSSDAYSNLNAAVDFLIDNFKQEKAFRRVGILMHSSINDDGFVVLDGINARKMHSTRRDAFKQINYDFYCQIQDGVILPTTREDLLSEKPDKNFSYVEFNENLKLGFLKAHPNLFPQEISRCDFYDAVVIEGTGLGHIGVNEVDENTKVHKDNLEELRKLSNRIPVIAGTQTVYGEVNLNVYSTGRYMVDVGVLGNHMNLTTESLFCRVAYVLSRIKESGEDFNEVWNLDLEGFKIRTQDVDY